MRALCSTGLNPAKVAPGRVVAAHGNGLAGVNELTAAGKSLRPRARTATRLEFRASLPPGRYSVTAVSCKKTEEKQEEGNGDDTEDEDETEPKTKEEKSNRLPLIVRRREVIPLYARVFFEVDKASLKPRGVVRLTKVRQPLALAGGPHQGRRTRRLRRLHREPDSQ